MPVSDTINQFRQDVLGKGGPQISAFYRVTMVGPNGDSLLCYPMSVIIPGRQFVYYEHDLWGTNRKIPYKRGYTQCHMTLIAYQDWQERTFIERWMNTIIKHKNSACKNCATEYVSSGLIILMRWCGAIFRIS